MAAPDSSAAPARVPLREVLVQWGRIGCIGFGGPPTHITLLRDLCVGRRQWIESSHFEDAIAACNLLPGPASTQLAILCAWTVAGPVGALAGGISAATVGPWLVVVLLACGAVELGIRQVGAAGRLGAHGVPMLLASAPATGGVLALAWVAIKVGALAYGGGFVIVPLMQQDAVNHYHW